MSYTPTPSPSLRHHLISAAGNNATVLSPAGTVLHGWYIYNNTASVRKIAFHDTNTAPSAGVAVYFSLVIPANSGANVSFPNGINFTTGIAYTTTTGIADGNTGVVSADDLTINLFYK